MADKLLLILILLMPLGAMAEQESDSLSSLPKTASPGKSPSLNSSDAFARVALGVLPVASGFYATPKPSLGIFFTGVDIVLIAGLWQAAREENQKKSSRRNYWLMLAAVNLADAAFALMQPPSIVPKPTVGLGLDGGWQTSLNWDF